MPFGTVDFMFVTGSNIIYEIYMGNLFTFSALR
jgi:hypothetical protein